MSAASPYRIRSPFPTAPACSSPWRVFWFLARLAPFGKRLRPSFSFAFTSAPLKVTVFVGLIILGLIGASAALLVFLRGWSWFWAIEGSALALFAVMKGLGFWAQLSKAQRRAAKGGRS